MGNFVSYRLFPIVFNMSMTASVVIVFVLLARLLLKRAPKVVSYALWSVVLFRLLCPVSLMADISLLNLFDTSVREESDMTSAMEYVQPNLVHTEFPQVHLLLPGVSETVNEMLPQGEEQLVADPLEAPVALVTMLWLSGIVLMLGGSLVSLLMLRAKLAEAAPLRGNIYLADRLGSPFVMGVLRPKIYLPSSLTPGEQEYILAHEQHHIRRGDHVIKLLAYGALCIHWFNPLVWAAFLLSAKDMEMSCDEAVVKRLGEHIRPDYAASLLSLATGQRIIAAAPLAFGEGDTKARIRNLTNWKKPKRWLTLTAAAVCVLVLAVCAVNPTTGDGKGIGSAVARSFGYHVLADESNLVELADRFLNRKEPYIPYNIKLYHSISIGQQKCVLCDVDGRLGMIWLEQGLGGQYKIESIGYGTNNYRYRDMEVDGKTYLLFGGRNAIGIRKITLDMEGREYQLDIPEGNTFFVFTQLDPEHESFYIDPNKIYFYNADGKDITMDIHW